MAEAVALEAFGRLFLPNPKAPRLKKFNRDWFFQSEID